MRDIRTVNSYDKLIIKTVSTVTDSCNEPEKTKNTDS